MELKIEKREVKGKKVNKHRKEGKVPGVVYGKHMKSPKNLFFNKGDFLKLYNQVGDTTPFYLKSRGYSEMVMVHELHQHPVTSQVVHVDFLAVKADEVTEVEVPVVMKGESPIEKTGGGRIEVLKDHILVEALPNEIPNQIELDISQIESPNDVVFVKDLDAGENVKIKEDFEQPVITVSEFTEEEPEEEEEEEITEEPEETSEEG